MELILVAQNANAIFGVGIICFSLVIAGFALAGGWMTFEKAGKPGWAMLIPFYNVWVMVEISGRETWWFFLFFVPIANIAAMFAVPIGIAEQFGKGTGFGIGLALLGPIFYPILGFGDAQYRGGAQSAAAH